jgi:hypothetical protein
VIDDADATVEKSLRPALDALYQTVGSPRSPNYDENGHWKGRDLTEDI